MYIRSSVRCTSKTKLLLQSNLRFLPIRKSDSEETDYYFTVFIYQMLLVLFFNMKPNAYFGIIENIFLFCLI